MAAVPATAVKTAVATIFRDGDFITPRRRWRMHFLTVRVPAPALVGAKKDLYPTIRFEV
jgi:hypothetical protein